MLTIKRFALLFFKNGLLAVSLSTCAVLAAATTMRVVLLSHEVPVPPLEGRRVPEAGALAARLGLLVRVEGKRYHDSIEHDRIVAQEPAPGASLKSQRSVRVWLSLGPRRLSIPPVEGDKLRSARLSLEQARIPLARVVEVDADADQGTVLVQRPPAGQADNLGEGVSLLVSRGRLRPEYVMPDLIGRPAAGLAEQLDAAGLRIADVAERAYPGVPPGIVLRQQPLAGHRVNPATAVSLEVSRFEP